MMSATPGIRSLHIESGNCVEGYAELFNQLDSGNVALQMSAEESCAACPDRDLCISRLSELSVRFAAAGIQKTVIAGTRLELQSPEGPNVPTRQRLSRSYFEGDERRCIEYEKLPDWFLLEFSQAQYGSLLAPIRKLAKARNSRAGISGNRWSRPALSLKSHVQDLSLSSASFTDKDTEKMQADICRFYSRIELNLGTFGEPDIGKMRALTLEYIRDCEALKELGFGDPLGVALNYSLGECAKVLTNPKYTQQLTKKMIIEAFEQNANADAMLDRFCRWFPEAQHRYAENKPALTEGTLRHLIFRAARQNDEHRVAVFVEGFLARFAAVQRLCVHTPSIPEYDIRGFALHYSSPEEAVAALERKWGAIQKIDGWRPVVSVEDGWLGGFVELSADNIVFSSQVSRDRLQEAIDRIDPNGMPIRQQIVDGRPETLYGEKMLIAISHQLSGRELADFQERFLLSDARMQKVRVFLLNSGYPIFTGDICSPEAYRLLCDNIATFYQD